MDETSFWLDVKDRRNLLFWWWLGWIPAGGMAAFIEQTNVHRRNRDGGVTKSILAIALLCVVSFRAHATTYRAEPIEARVVDAETGQPIEGVVVTANWELERGTVGGNVPFGQIMVMESTTDQEGRFYFPAWGPKSTPFYLPIPMLESGPHLVNLDPQILLFKGGYRWLGLRNELVGSLKRGEIRVSDWNGKTVRMERAREDLKEYSRHLNLLRTQLSFIEEVCNWKRTPNMVLALDKQSRFFRSRGIGSNLYSIDELERTSEAQKTMCGSAREFFEGLQR